MSALTTRIFGRSKRTVLVWRLAAVAVLAVVWLITPLILSDSSLTALVYCGVFAIAAVGLVLLSGYGGQSNFAQPTFMMVGAYTTVNLGAGLQLPMLVYIPVAVILAGALGAVVGSLAFRLGGAQLAIVTFGVLLLGLYLAFEWKDVTGGENGKSAALASLAIGPLDFESLGDFTSSQSKFWLVWVVVALVAAASLRLLSQRPGSSLIAVRENPRAASTLGVNVRSEKMKAFIWSSALGGLAGALYAAFQQYATPSDFGTLPAIFLMAMIVVGGHDSVPGAIVGAIVLWGGKFWVTSSVGNDGPLSWLVKVPGGTQGFISAGDLMTLLTGVLVIVVLIGSPDGLAGFARKSVAWLRRRLEVDAKDHPHHNPKGATR